MAEVGQILRQSREDKGITLKQVEQTLKIRCKFLSALENDERITGLNDIYVKGFLRTYALYLGLDADEILRIYATGREPMPDAQPKRAAPVPVSAPSTVSGDVDGPRPRSRYVALGVSAGGIILGFAILAAAISFITKASLATPAEATTVMPTDVTVVSQVMSDTLAITLTPAGTPTPTPRPTRTPTPTVTPTVTNTPTPEFYTGVNIELVASANAWTQIRVDGEKVFEGMLEPGTRKHWRGEERVEVRCGNAGGVEAIVNGESMGLLGADGQVIELEWQKENGSSPAPTPTVEPPTAEPTDEVTFDVAPAPETTEETAGSTN